MRLRPLRAAALLAALAGCATGAANRAAPAPAIAAAPGAAGAGPERDYFAFVLSESADLVSLVRFGPDGLTVERQTKVGLLPTEINGPHGVGVAPDGRHYYVSIAHGMPYGSLWKLTTVGDTVVGRVTLGLFPASLQVSPDGAYVYVANFNLHGDMVPSSVSVVAADEMVEVARVPTCTMPHGSRLDARGAKHYSTCMMDDVLVEIDTRTFAVSRHFMVAAGREHGMDGPPRAAAHAGGHGAAAMPAPSCSPTWAAPTPDGARIFVACNKSNDIVEVDAATWTLRRRIPAGDGVYNLAVSPDGRLLVATNKRGNSVSVIDVTSGRELGRIPTRRKVVHGVAITHDGRYAFVTVEGVGSEPGTVEVVDLRSLRSVASADVGQQAAGVDVWRGAERD
ncbi:MAG: YncE family protein [Gemmatimonadaceae bacterium]